MALYKALFGDGEWKFTTHPQALVSNFPKGPALDQLTPLVKGFGDPVYLVDQGQKRHIANPDVYNRYGFSWDKIVNIGSVTALIPDGPQIKWGVTR